MKKEPLNCFFFNNTKDIIVKPKPNPQHDQGQKVVYHDQRDVYHPILLEGERVSSLDVSPNKEGRKQVLRPLSFNEES